MRRARGGTDLPLERDGLRQPDVPDELRLQSYRELRAGRRGDLPDDGDVRGALKGLPDLERSIGKFAEEVSGFLDQSEDVAVAESIDDGVLEKAKPLIEKLKSEFSSSSFGSQATLDELLDILSGTPQADQLSPVVDVLSKYDFESAQSQLDSLASEWFG